MARVTIGAGLVGLVVVAIACGDATSTGDGPESGGGGATGGAVAGTSGGASGSGGGGAGAGGSTVAGAGVSGAGTGATSTGGTSAGGTGASGTGAQIDAGTGDDAGSSGGLPDGDMGIAAKYPGDLGIAGDPNVVFVDDFERYSANAMGPELNQVWDAVYQNQYVSIATEPENVNHGSQALELTVPQQDEELSDAADKLLDETLDVLHLRYYSKFQPPYDVVGSSHNGASISAQYFDGNMATPGVPANGTNKFLVNLENWRGDAMTPSPGQLNVYVYHPEQRGEYGDHFYPTGLVNPNTSIPFDFGPDFVERPDVIPELDRWYCYEYMVQANTPGQRDGRIAIWLDGKLVADFPNLRLRDVDDLKIDRFGLSFHIKSNPNGESKKWYDDVVAATSYIGCIAP